jgi:hypothetical protein
MTTINNDEEVKIEQTGANISNETATFVDIEELEQEFGDNESLLDDFEAPRPLTSTRERKFTKIGYGVLIGIVIIAVLMLLIYFKLFSNEDNNNNQIPQFLPYFSILKLSYVSSFCFYHNNCINLNNVTR